MCGFSKFAENTRDAIVGENLDLTRAPHGTSNWFTEPGKPNIAVCIPDAAPLAIRIPGLKDRRAANFMQLDNVDYLVFLDGRRERVALENLPYNVGIEAKVLAIVWNPPTKTLHTVARMNKEKRRERTVPEKELVLA